MSADPWAAPTAGPVAMSWELPKAEPSHHSTRKDLIVVGVIVVGCLLLAAPAGLLWSALAPHYTIVFDKGEANYPYIESTKAFIGADGSYFLVMLGMGLVTGILVWWKGRSAGPWAVFALVLGGVLAAFISARVGVLPGSKAAIHAINAKQGSVDLFLGRRDSHGHLHLRAPWAALAWPVGALLAFGGQGLVKPEQLD